MANKKNPNKSKRSYRRSVPRSAKERAKSDQRIRQELLALRTEIDEDLEACRIDIIDYEFCKAMIKRQLELLDAPSKPGEIRVIGLPKKRIDWKMLQKVQREIGEQTTPPSRS